jgi:hypothetical protein
VNSDVCKTEAQSRKIGGKEAASNAQRAPLPLPAEPRNGTWRRHSDGADPARRSQAKKEGEAEMKTADASRLTQTSHWFRFCLPYQFVKVELGGRKHTYLPLNRNYKPLGVLGRAHIKYEDYAPQAVVFGSDPHTFKGVWSDPKGLYLYDDNTRSRVDYFERLEKLLSRTMPMYGKTGL